MCQSWTVNLWKFSCAKSYTMRQPWCGDYTQYCHWCRRGSELAPISKALTNKFYSVLCCYECLEKISNVLPIYLCDRPQLCLLVYFIAINVTFIWINLVVYTQYKIKIFTRVNRRYNRKILTKLGNLYSSSHPSFLTHRNLECASNQLVTLKPNLYKMTKIIIKIYTLKWTDRISEPRKNFQFSFLIAIEPI